MSVIDFARSTLIFRTTRVQHTPRLQLDATCTLTGRDGETRRFVLTCPCIGEHMYLDTGLIQEPPFEFLMIAEHQREYAIIRKHASAAHDVREAHRFGESMSTRSGVPAALTGLDVRLTPYPHLQAVRPDTAHADLRAALDHDWPVVGRTTYLDPDGETTVVLDYPVKILNVAIDRPVWQVDTGPILVPDLQPGGVGAEGPLAGRFTLAFLVFNRWDRAELALRRPTPLLPAEPGRPSPLATEHYSQVRTLAARHELFCATDKEHEAQTDNPSPGSA
jgi:hypothetical protein